MIYKTPWFIRWAFPNIIWRIPGNKNTVYITFDDGPHPEVTNKILEILNLYNAKATFFCVGENVTKYPDTYKKILEEGHSTGNHTHNHLKGWKTSNNDYFENISLAGKYIRSNLFRPPYGKIKYSQYKYLRKHYKIVLWQILSGDFIKGQPKETCLNKVIKHVKSGSVIVFHDSVKTRDKILYVLPRFLENLKNRGFVCKNIDMEK